MNIASAPNAIRIDSCEKTGDLIAIAPKGQKFRSNGEHRVTIAEKLFFPDKSEIMQAMERAIPKDPLERCDCKQCQGVRRQPMDSERVKKMMRDYRTSIVYVAEQMGVTMKQVRLFRERGIDDRATYLRFVAIVTAPKRTD